MIMELPPSAFSNAMNDINPAFNYQNWRCSPEWKIFMAGHLFALETGIMELSGLRNLGLHPDKLYAKGTTYIRPLGTWSHHSTYTAKVGTMSLGVIVVKKATEFHIDQKIEFAYAHDLRGCPKNIAPKWTAGRVWKVEDNCLFVNLD